MTSYFLHLFSSHFESVNVFGTSSLSDEKLNDLGSMNREAEMLYSRKLLHKLHICLPANWKFRFV